MLVATGCGPSDGPTADQGPRTEQLIQDMKSSPEVFIELAGNKDPAILSAQQVDELGALLRTSKSDRTGRKYVVLGHIKHQLTDGGEAKALLLWISDFEVGLQISGHLYLRGINRQELDRIAGFTSTNQDESKD
jgi:hypothetical protein